MKKTINFMEYRFTFIDKDGEEETSVCRGNNFMDALWSFYDLEGMRNILLAFRFCARADTNLIK